MTRNTTGVWSYRRDGLEISSSSLDSLISALMELKIKPRAEKKAQEFEEEMNRLEGGSDEWLVAKIKKEVWEEVAKA